MQRTCCMLGMFWWTQRLHTIFQCLSSPYLLSRCYRHPGCRYWWSPLTTQTVSVPLGGDFHTTALPLQIAQQALCCARHVQCCRNVMCCFGMLAWQDVFCQGSNFQANVNIFKPPACIG